MAYIVTNNKVQNINSVILFVLSEIKMKEKFSIFIYACKRLGLIRGDKDWQFYFRLLQINDRKNISNKKLEKL